MRKRLKKFKEIVIALQDKDAIVYDGDTGKGVHF